MKHEKLSRLTDHQLLSRTRELVQQERDHSIAIIHHLREIRQRGLHLARGYSSLFDYAVKVLRYSDGAAFRRLQTLKLCAAHPEVEERLRSGALTLTTAAQIQTAIEQREKRRRSEQQQQVPDGALELPRASSPQAAPAPRGLAPALAANSPQTRPLAAAAAPAPQGRPGPQSQNASQDQPVPQRQPVPQDQPVPQRQPAPQSQPTPQRQPAPQSQPTPQRQPAPGPQPVFRPEAAHDRDLIEQAEGRSSRQVARLIADLTPQAAPPRERLRPLGHGHWELRVVVDDSCHAGLDLLRALLSHVNPALSYGELLSRLVADGTKKYDPCRQTGRAAAAGGAGTAPNPAPAREATSAPKPAATGATSPATNSAPEPRPASAPKLAAATDATCPATNSAPEPRPASAPKLTAANDATCPATNSAPERRPASAPKLTAASAKNAGAAQPAAANAELAADSAAAAGRALATHLAVAATETPAQPDRTPARNARSPGHPPAASTETPSNPRHPGPGLTGASCVVRTPPAPSRRAVRVARAIPAELRRFVWRRDEGICTFVDPETGQRCGSRHLLQIDHIQPFAMGGTSSADNLRLLCGAHNRHRARKSFGSRRAWGAASRR